jgi:serine/threonine protein phosphatase 1
MRYYPDKYLVTGHVPTFTIDPACEGRIYIRNGHIAIDCGACHGKNLGCIRLDDLAEFYV